ncbi:MAG: glycosyltransferase family 2 protein [Myxococcales bacterium]|nr:glycosyltransferase family 2 protein [Myxococcales bacterium]
MSEGDVFRPEACAASSEIVEIAGESLLAYPAGRHETLRALPLAATVLLPVWNEAPVLPRALSSLAAQTWRDFAILIVDNASTDQSHAVARRFVDAHDNAVVYHRGHGTGRSSLWNVCLDLAFGAYTKLLEAPDVLAPGFMGASVEALESDRDLSLVRTGVSLLREGRRVEAPAFSASRTMTGPGALVQALTTTNLLGPPSGQLMRRHTLEVRGLRYRSDLQRGAATELGLQLLVTGDFGYVHEPLVIIDEDSPRPANQCGARVCFRDECEARLSVLRDARLPLPSRTLIRTLNHLATLFETYAGRAEEEGQDAEIERDYAAAVTELSALLQRSVHAPPTVAGARQAEVARLLAAAESSFRARHFEPAARQLRQLLAVSPCHAVALVELGRVCLACADLDGARKYFLSALALDPTIDLWPLEARAPSAAGSGPQDPFGLALR